MKRLFSHPIRVMVPLFFLLLSASFSAAQPQEGSMMGSGMGCPMMQRMSRMMGQQMGGPMRMGRGMDLMDMLHQWGALILTEKDRLGISPDQLEKIESIMMEHVRYAIPRNANREVLLLESADLLGREKVDLAELEKRVKALESLESDLNMEGIRTLERMLDVLTPEQQKKAKSLFRWSFFNRMMRMPAGPGTSEEGPVPETEKPPKETQEKPHSH